MLSRPGPSTNLHRVNDSHMLPQQHNPLGSCKNCHCMNSAEDQWEDLWRSLFQFSQAWQCFVAGSVSPSPQGRALRWDPGKYASLLHWLKGLQTINMHKELINNCNNQYIFDSHIQKWMLSQPTARYCLTEQTDCLQLTYNVVKFMFPSAVCICLSA